MSKTKATKSTQHKSSTEEPISIKFNVSAKALKEAIKRLQPILKAAKGLTNRRYSLGQIMVTSIVDDQPYDTPLSTYILLTATDGIRLHSIKLPIEVFNLGSDKTKDILKTMFVAMPSNLTVKGNLKHWVTIEIILDSTAHEYITPGYPGRMFLATDGWNCMFKLGDAQLPSTKHIHNVFSLACPTLLCKAGSKVDIGVPEYNDYVNDLPTYEDNKWLIYKIDQKLLRRAIDGTYVRLGKDGDVASLTLGRTISTNIILNRQYLLEFLADEEADLIINIDKIGNHLRILRNTDTFIQMGCDEDRATKYARCKD